MKKLLFVGVLLFITAIAFAVPAVITPSPGYIQVEASGITYLIKTDQVAIAQIGWDGRLWIGLNNTTEFFLKIDGLTVAEAKTILADIKEQKKQ